MARSANFLVENRNLISRVKFPAAVLPCVPVLSGFCGQVIGFLVLLVWAGIKGKLQAPAVFFLPVWMILQICFGLGLGYFFSVVGAWVRDLIQLVPVLLLVWMYATPIFYPANLVPEKFQMVVWLNPVAQMVNGYRGMILEGALPSLGQIKYFAVAAFASLAIGWAVFANLRKGIADRI